MSIKKVLYLVSSLKRSGPTNQLFYIVNNLDREKFEPVIMTLSHNPQETLKPLFENLNLEIIEYPMKRWVVNPKGLLNKVESIKPDVIHSCGIRPDRFVAKLFTNYPTICTVRNYMFADYPATYGNILGNLMAISHLKYLRSIDRPIACSNSIQQEYQKKHNITLGVVQNGVDTKKFNTITKEEQILLRGKLNLPKDKIIYISTGHLSSRKDPLLVIKAFKESKASKEGCLLFLGDGHLKEECLKEAKGLDNILFLGRVQNVDEYLKASNVFVSASKAEGLPNAMLEAMASNLVICVSDINPHLEILSLGDYSGEYFEVGNLNECIQSFNKICTMFQTKKVPTLINRVIIEKNLSSQIMSLNYQNIYFEMV